MLYEQNILMERLVWPLHVQLLHHSSLTLPNLHPFVQLTKSDFHHMHIWALCVLYLSAGNRNIPPHECDLDITNHSCTQEDESLRSFLFVLSLQVLAQLALTSQTEYFCLAFSFSFYPPPLFMLQQQTYDCLGWSQQISNLHFCLISSRDTGSLTYLDAEHHQGVAYRPPEWISLVAVEDLRVGL